MLLHASTWHDQSGRALGYQFRELSLSDACKFSFENPENLLIVIEDFALPDISLYDLVQKSRFIISDGTAFFIVDKEPPNKTWVYKEEIQCEVISREQAKGLIKLANLPKPKTDPCINFSNETLELKSNQTLE